MSRARLRALERAPIRRSPSRLHAAQVRRVAGVDLDPLALPDEERDLDLVTGLERGRLRAAGRAVTGNAGLGERDLQLDGCGHLQVEHATLVGRDDRLLVLEEEVLGVTDELGRDL